MGYFDLIPAKTLRAVYDGMSQHLTLFAEGDTMGPYSHYQFVPIPIIGGLRYELRAWKLPGIPEEIPYNFDKAFKIIDITVRAPSGYINVVCLNGTFRVKIEGIYLPTDQNPSSGIETAVHAEHNEDLGVTEYKEEQKIITKVGEKFNVSLPLPDTKRGTLSEFHSPTALSIDTVNVRDGNLYITYKALETGGTEIITFGGQSAPTPYVWRQAYTVDVVLCDNAAAILQVDKANSVASKSNETLSFLGMLFEAVNIVRKYAPDAQLVSVHATPPGALQLPVFDPRLLTQLTCTLTTEDKTWTIKSAGWGSWLPPFSVDGHLLGVKPIDVENVKVGIVDAVKNMRKDGYKGAFNYCDVSFPRLDELQYPDEPIYSFNMVNGSVVMVGMWTGNVWENATGQTVLPPLKT